MSCVIPNPVTYFPWRSVQKRKKRQDELLWSLPSQHFHTCSWKSFYKITFGWIKSRCGCMWSIDQVDGKCSLKPVTDAIPWAQETCHFSYSERLPKFAVTPILWISLPSSIILSINRSGTLMHVIILWINFAIVFSGHGPLKIARILSIVAKGLNLLHSISIDWRTHQIWHPFKVSKLTTFMASRYHISNRSQALYQEYQFNTSWSCDRLASEAMENGSILLLFKYI